MKFKAVIFDLDGTLLDSLPDIAKSMNIILERLGYSTHPQDLYKYLVGEGIRELVKKALPQDKSDDIDRLVVEFREVYSTQWREQTKPYMGIPETLNALVERKIKMGVLSNKLDDFVKRMVSELLKDWEFDAVFGTRPGVPLKPDPSTPLEIAAMMNTSPEEIIFVGDSGIDMETAVNSGMFPLGVLWGLRDAQELLSFGAKKLIERPMDLVDMFETRGLFC